MKRKRKYYKRCLNKLAWRFAPTGATSSALRKYRHFKPSFADILAKATGISRTGTTLESLRGRVGRALTREDFSSIPKEPPKP